MKILVVNAGSSSLKCWYDDLRQDALDAAPPQPLWSTHVDWNEKTDIAALFESVLKSLPGAVDVVGHRIVHGGRFRASAVLTPEVRAAIAEETAIAPAHNRIALKAVDILQQHFGPKVTQIAVFDTAFHATLAPEAYIYPGPYSWYEAGIRRYGFHGISHRYASRRAAQLLGRDPSGLRIVTCHLGSGASLAAVRGRKKYRHHHGLHAARRPDDGLAQRLGRPRHSGLSCCGSTTTRPISSTIFCTSSRDC